jgi:FAD/FMN-containing dehydrogenase
MIKTAGKPGSFGMHWQQVQSFVGSTTTDSWVAYPGSEADCLEVLRICREQKLSVCVRGSARSYGDAILNDGNVLLDMSRMNRILDFDEASGRIRAEAGAKVVDVFAASHHLGFTLPASPTDSTISVGGALAANVNGKESWRLGNFGDQVVNLKLLLASGEIRLLDRDTDRALFMAVIGGMGLLGIVLEATLQLQRIPSPYLQVEIMRAHNLDNLLMQLDEYKTNADFLVVWIDAYARGSKLGRSVIHATRWVKVDKTADELAADVARGVELLAKQKRRAMAVYGIFRPLINLGFHVQTLLFGLFNRFYYWLYRNPVRNSDPALFLEHNFDKSYVVPPPDILCGPHGFTIQISVPQDHAIECIGEMLQICRAAPCPPATTILRLHRKDEHLISFSENGYSLNVEFHPKARHRRAMQEMTQKLFECGIRYGSKVHLPKDFSLNRQQFRQLFPNYRQFLELKKKADPEELFQSDMYRRFFRDT